MSQTPVYKRAYRKARVNRLEDHTETQIHPISARAALLKKNKLHLKAKFQVILPLNLNGVVAAFCRAKIHCTLASSSRNVELPISAIFQARHLEHSTVCMREVYTMFGE